MFNIRRFLFFFMLSGLIVLSGCTAPSESASASQPKTDVSIPASSQPAQPDVSAGQPDTPPAVSESEPEPVAPPVVSKPEPEPCSHAKTNAVTTQAATCTAQGHGNTVCAVCNEVVASGTIPPLGHDYRTTVVDATCETAGVRTNTCSRCGDVQTEPIPAPGHDWSAAACGTTATCNICNTTSATVTDHSWVVKYAMGTPECEHCGAKYTFDKLNVKSNHLNVPLLVEKKHIQIIEMNYTVRSFEGPFNAQSTCRLDITVNGQASNACTLTRGSHLIAEDGTIITSIYDDHAPISPVCDGSFTEMFSFDIPSCEGTYIVVFSVQ